MSSASASSTDDSSLLPSPIEKEGHRIGSSQYHKITLSLFAAGITIFASMYSTQALLPALSTYFHISPAHAALTVSLTTGCVAIMIIPASILSERFGRTRVMLWSSILTTFIGLLIPFSPNMHMLFIGRAIQGLVLSGVPAVAMAYISEEIHHESLGTAMGRYIAGNTLGGLAGRLISACSLNFFEWRGALFIVGLIALVCTIVFMRNIPSSQFFTPKSLNARAELTYIYHHITYIPLTCLFTLGFLLMGGFVSLYNYLGYRLEGSPFFLSPSLAGFVFIIYLAGTYSSAQSGIISDRIGQPAVLIGSLIIALCGLLLTIPNWFPTIIIGTILFTGGIFGAHPTASAWVGKIATQHRGEAAGMYLSSYYCGSAILGATSGLFYQHKNWNNIVIFIAILLLLSGVATTILLRSLHTLEQTTHNYSS